MGVIIAILKIMKTVLLEAYRKVGFDSMLTGFPSVKSILDINDVDTILITLRNKYKQMTSFPVNGFSVKK